VRRIEWWKVPIAAILILGFSAILIPSPLAEPNVQGVPAIPITLFVLAVTLYAIVKKDRKTLYATIGILVILFAYTGFWFYNYKIPLSSLMVTMSPISVRNNPPRDFLGNQCDIHIDLAIQNPTDINTPPFMIENVNFYIDSVRLSLGTYTMWGWHAQGGLGRQGVWYHDTHIIIDAHQTLNLSESRGYFSFSIYSNRTKVEEGSFESLWENVITNNFTLGFSGSFTSRPDHKKLDHSWQSMHVLASTQFIASCRFTED